MKQLNFRYIVILLGIIFPIISEVYAADNRESVIVLKRSVSKIIENKNDSLYETEIVESHLLLNDFKAINRYNVLYFNVNDEISVYLKNKDSDFKLISVGENLLISKTSYLGILKDDDYLDEEDEDIKKVSIPDLDPGDEILIITKSRNFIGDEKNNPPSVLNLVLSGGLPGGQLYLADQISRRVQYNYLNAVDGKKTRLYFFEMDFPITNLNFQITIPKTIYFSYLTKNISFTENKIDKGDSITYFFSTSNLNKKKIEPWSLRLIDNPHISFQVLKINNKKKAKSHGIFFSQNQINKIDSTNILKFYLERKKLMEIKYKDELKKFDYIKSAYKTKDAKKYIFNWLNYLKNENFKKFIYRSLGRYQVNFNSEYLVFNLARISEKFLTPYKVSIYLPEKLGSLDSLSSSEYLSYFITIYFKDAPITFYGSEINSLGLAKPNNIHNAEAFEISVNSLKLKTKYELKRVKLPAIKISPNRIQQEIKLSFDTSTFISKMAITTKYFGSYRNPFIYSEESRFAYVDSLLQALSKYRIFVFANTSIYDKTYNWEALAAEEKRLVEDNRNYNLKRFKLKGEETMKNYFNLISYDTIYYNTKSFYYTETEQEVIKTEKITIKDFVVQSGNYYVLNIGKILYDIPDYKKFELNRRSAIYHEDFFDYYHEYKVLIPYPYTLTNIKPLQFDIQNEVGQFVVEANFEKPVLNIKIKRQFYNLISPANTIAAYRELLKAAVDFSNKQLFLEKEGNQ